jgi:hypothetical protein
MPHHPSTQLPLFNELALRAMGLDQAADEQPAAPAGKMPRIVIGLVDYGFDLLHPCLLDVQGTTTRFKYLWDQNRTPTAVRCQRSPVAAAFDYSHDDLNQMIAKAHRQGTRHTLDAIYDPHANYYGRDGVTDGAHGTLMASIAAGTAFDGYRSPAPFADLIGVQVAVADTDWREESPDGEPAWCDWHPTAADPDWSGWRTYDACPQIVHAIHYIYDRACRLSADLVIINLSIGTWAGAHNGLSPVEQAIANVIAQGQRPGATACQVVVGAGNSGADQGHLAAVLEPGKSTTFQWQMNRSDPTQNKLEIWYQSGPLTVTLTGPSSPNAASECVPKTLALGTHQIMIGGTRVGLADHVPAAQGQLSRLRILLHPPYFTAELGPELSEDRAGSVITWTLTVTHAGPASADCVNIHAWVERDDGVTERSWLVPHSSASTLCCLATAPGALVIGAGHHHTADGTLSPALPFSSIGPRPWPTGTGAPPRSGAPRNGAVTDDDLNVALAPGYRIWGAKSKTTGFTETTGTSPAAALMSGRIAAQFAAEFAAEFGGAWCAQPPRSPTNQTLSANQAAFAQQAALPSQAVVKPEFVA